MGLYKYLIIGAASFSIGLLGGITICRPKKSVLEEVVQNIGEYIEEEQKAGTEKIERTPIEKINHNQLMNILSYEIGIERIEETEVGSFRGEEPKRRFCLSFNIKNEGESQGCITFEKQNLIMNNGAFYEHEIGGFAYGILCIPPKEEKEFEVAFRVPENLKPVEYRVRLKAEKVVIDERLEKRTSKELKIYHVDLRNAPIWKKE